MPTEVIGHCALGPLLPVKEMGWWIVQQITQAHGTQQRIGTGGIGLFRGYRGLLFGGVVLACVATRRLAQGYAVSVSDEGSLSPLPVHLLFVAWT